MSNKHLALPALVCLSEYGGSFHNYLEAIYAIFKRDFIESKPSFRGQRLGLKRLPISDGKEATFWHMTSEGCDEESRTPDLRRMERIGWPAPIINQSEHPTLLVWENKRGTNINILIFHPEEDYLVILRKVRDYLLPWTAYLVDSHRKRKLLKEYEEYKKSWGRH